MGGYGRQQAEGSDQWFQLLDQRDGPVSHLPVKAVARIYGPVEESLAKFQDQLIAILNPFMKMVVDELHVIDRYVAKIPASVDAAGSTGQYAIGEVGGIWYLYVCVAPKTWRRVALGTF